MRKGQKVSEAGRERMSKAALASGHRSPSRLGIPNSPEQRAKISETQKKRGHRPKPMYGDDNPSRRPEVKAKLTEALRGDKNRGWKGDEVGYNALHTWVRRTLGTPSECEFCGVEGEEFNYEWANLSQQYRRDVSDWARLCKKCHSVYDQVPQKAWATKRAKNV